MRKDTGAWSIFRSSDRYCILALICSSKFLRMMLETPSLRDFSAHGLESHYEFFFYFTLGGIHSFYKHIWSAQCVCMYNNVYMYNKYIFIYIICDRYKGFKLF